MTFMQENFILANGVELPKIGFGTWQIADGSDTYDAVAFALAHGYRHIDTAHAYGNEASVGRAVRDSGIKRADIFVTSKLPAEVKSHGGALVSFEATMAALRLDYLDLYLIHAPWPWDKMGQDFSAENRAVWGALESLYASGRVRAIGVSNFDASDLAAIIEGATVKPMVNQIKFFIGNTQQPILDFCHANSIQVIGFSPLATGAILDQPAVKAMAARYDKSVAQLCIRYVVQKGVAPLPKSVTPARIASNTVLDFAISAGDMASLDALTDTAAFHTGPKKA